jgi:hypothetical protein
MHTVVLMWHVMACHRVWKRADGVEGFLRVAGRAMAGTAVYSAIAVVQWVLVLGFAGILSMSPEAVTKLNLPAGLAFGTAVATFLLPWQATSGSLPLAFVVVLASFFLLGLATMLPGLGYGSKVAWGAIGVMAYAAYLFISIGVLQELYAGAAALVAASTLAALAIMWLLLKAGSALRVDLAQLADTGVEASG